MGIVLGYSLLSLVNSSLPAVLKRFAYRGLGSGCKVTGSDLREQTGLDPQAKPHPDRTL